MREFEILHHIFARNDELQRDPRVLIPPGDDMAMVKMSGRRLLAAVDQMVDGVHVNLATTPLELVGRKAVTRSLSDIAAMAGWPVATLVAATLPPDFGQARATVLLDAMRTTALHYDCPIIGGDLAIHRVESAPLMCSVTVLAEPWGPRAITRSGAKVGDMVCVTGPLGGSLEPNGLGRHLTFEPRLKLARDIALQFGDRLHAMIDISDGLGRDAGHIADMSNVQIILDAAKIPCNPGCDYRRALGDGEDYELCFTIQPPLQRRIAGIDMFEIGQVIERRSDDSRLVMVKEGQDILSADELGWEHGRPEGKKV